MTELKPCPFCGAKQEENSTHWSDANGPRVYEKVVHANPSENYVRCLTCYARGPYKIYGGEEDGIRLWNSRG